ncbi:MAG: hypothetical protein WAU81_16345, partial [Candidatus Aminicenantales bacterium]
VNRRIVKGSTVLDRKISFDDIFLSVFAFLEFANYFYQIIGYSGLCKLKYIVKNTLNVALDPFLGGTGILGWQGVAIVDEIEVAKEYEVCSIPKITNKDYRLDYLTKITKNIAWSFGSEYDQSRGVDEILLGHANSQLR